MRGGLTTSLSSGGRSGRADKAVQNLVVASVLVGLAAASFSLTSTQAVGASTPGKGTPSVGSSSTTGELFGVTAVRGGGTWAVGYSGTGSSIKPLTLYSKGAGWKAVPSPSPPSAELHSVAGTSLTNAWAVGYSGDPSNTKTLILHWNGKAWRQMPSRAGMLSGVAVSSATNAWAVGSTNSGDSLIMHWNGKTWQQTPSSAGTLSGVAVTSAKNAWAVGSTNSGDTMVLHWNGKTWQQTPSPSPGSDQGLASFLTGVVVSSRGTIWAVGNGNNCGCGPGTPLVERWNKNVWEQVPTPLPGDGVNLFGIASLPSGQAWAVGLSGSGDGPTSSVALQWTGKAWIPKAIPNLSNSHGGLFGVAATSRSNGWVVGWETVGGSPAGTDKIVILHWNGSTWKVPTIAGLPRTSLGTTTTTTVSPNPPTTGAPNPTAVAPTTSTTVPSPTTGSDGVRWWGVTRPRKCSMGPGIGLIRRD